MTFDGALFIAAAHRLLCQTHSAPHSIRELRKCRRANYCPLTIEQKAKVLKRTRTLQLRRAINLRKARNISLIGINLQLELFYFSVCELLNGFGIFSWHNKKHIITVAHVLSAYCVNLCFRCSIELKHIEI